MIYRYDGTFPGFLCAVYEAYQDGTSHTEGICTAMAPGGLFSSEKEVRTISDRAERVAQAFFRTAAGRRSGSCSVPFWQRNRAGRMCCSGISGTASV